MRVYGWGLLVLCHHAGKFCDHIHCYVRVTMFLVCQVTSHEHMFKGLCEFMGGISSR